MAKRAMEARIWSADFFQRKGLGCLLWAAMNSLIAVSSS